MSFDDRDLYETDPRGENCCECGSEDVCASRGQDLYCGECWRNSNRVSGALADQFAELGDDE